MIPAAGAVPPALNTFGQVLGNFQAVAISASAALTPYAQHLLMALFAIELVWTACLWSLSARSGYEILEQLCRRGIAIGLIYWFISNAVTLLTGIFAGFQQLGAKTIGVTNVSPGGVLWVGTQMAGDIIDGYAHSSFWISLIKGDAGAVILVPLIAALVILIAFTVAATWYLMTMIEMYVVIGGAAIVAALGGSSFSGALFTRLLSRIVGLGLRLMFLILTLGVGMKLANDWLTVTQTTTTITPTMFFYLIANALMFALTVLGVPYMISSLANDSVNFGLAQAFEAAWLAGTISKGVQMGLKAAKHVAGLNASHARVAKASAVQQAMAQMPGGPEKNYPPPPPPPSRRGPSGPPIAPPSNGAGGPPRLGGPSGAYADGNANGSSGTSGSGNGKTHLTLDLSQWTDLPNGGNGNGGKSS